MGGVVFAVDYWIGLKRERGVTVIERCVHVTGHAGSICEQEDVGERFTVSVRTVCRGSSPMQPGLFA